MWAKSRRARTEGRNGSVVLFNDTFMNYNYPGVGIAAVEILEAAGFNVITANPVCCGRPMISKGTPVQSQGQRTTKRGPALPIRTGRDSHNWLRAKLPADPQGRMSRPFDRREGRRSGRQQLPD